MVDCGCRFQDWANFAWDWLILLSNVEDFCGLDFGVAKDFVTVSVGWG